MPVMDTYVGGGAALFALGIGKLGLHPEFQGEVGDDCYGELIRKEFAAKISTTAYLKRAGRRKPVFRSVLPMKGSVVSDVSRHERGNFHRQGGYRGREKRFAYSYDRL